MTTSDDGARTLALLAATEANPTVAAHLERISGELSAMTARALAAEQLTMEILARRDEAIQESLQASIRAEAAEAALEAMLKEPGEEMLDEVSRIRWEAKHPSTPWNAVSFQTKSEWAGIARACVTAWQAIAARGK